MEIGDCRLSAISYLLYRDNIMLPPVMCFGLGEGYDFSFWVERSGRVPLIAIMGRTTDCESHLLNRLGVSFVDIGDSSATAQSNKQELESVLDEGRCVALTVDRYYLKALRDKFGPTHCGFHSLVVFKNTDNDDCYGVRDVLAPDIDTISKTEVSQARSSAIHPFPPLYRGCYLSDQAELAKRQQATSQVVDAHMIYQAVESNMKQYRCADTRGIHALQSFVDQFAHVTKSSTSSLKKLFLKVQIDFIVQMIAEVDDTHSFHRLLYKHFLQESQDRYDCAFPQAIREFSYLGSLWEALVNKLADVKALPTDARVTTLLDELRKILEYEDKASRTLLAEAESGLDTDMTNGGSRNG